jgi:hypothetical protein
MASEFAETIADRVEIRFDSAASATDTACESAEIWNDRALTTLWRPLTDTPALVLAETALIYARTLVAAADAAAACASAEVAAALAAFAWVSTETI